MRGASPQPLWSLFWLSNVVAVGVLAVSASYLAACWDRAGAGSGVGSMLAGVSHAVCVRGGGGSNVWAPVATVAAAAGTVGAMLYLVAFFGVAFMHEDVMHETYGGRAATSAAGGRAPPSPLRRMYDADVVIVGAGTAGAALAVALARDGKRVTVIEKNMDPTDRIVGELMQPGGIRVLERMGLGDCAKTPAIDPVMVEGYVCMTPGTPASEDLILTYPPSDPASKSEYFGVMTPGARVRVNSAYAGGGRSGGVVATTSGSDSPRAGEGASTDVHGVDPSPRGRSFHNHLFVQELRKRMLAEPNITVCLGTAARVLMGSELNEPTSVFGARGAGGKAPEDGRRFAADLDVADTMAALRTSLRPAPTFAGYDGADRSRGMKPAGAPPEVDPATKARKTLGPTPTGTIVGVSWTDADGGQHVTTARLTVVADGMYSSLRKDLHASSPRCVSFCCGVILKHAPGKTPLPYPNRGHVLMADPHPVLLYQISATETRVLVDIPGDSPPPQAEMRKYFLERIAPQMPECVRAAFIEAAKTQDYNCCGNRLLHASPASRPGAVMIGDSWNMRHPLTGSGMTVALKDAEACFNAVRGLDLQEVLNPDFNAAIERFQTRRMYHAATLNVLATALYRVFSRPAGDNGTRERLRAACVEYLCSGGMRTAGPVGLLAGLTPLPSVLVSHFFAVASHAMYNALVPFPTPRSLRQAYDLLHIACQIIMPLAKAEGVPLLSSRLVMKASDTLFPWSTVDPVAMR